MRVCPSGRRVRCGYGSFLRRALRRARELAFGYRPRGLVSPHRTPSALDRTGRAPPPGLQDRDALRPRVCDSVRSLQRNPLAEQAIARHRGRSIRERARARHAVPPARPESNTLQLVSRAAGPYDMQRASAHRAP